ncbi:TPA: HAD family hydrolase [Streptococcus suis]|nr:HAD family hydrolase [Streptococcus suis]
MIKKIYASDMDGTFLGEDHNFDKKSFRRILDQFKKKDYLFVAASGRSLQSLKLVFEEFADEIGFVAENGSIVEYQGQMIFLDEPIRPEVYLPIIAGIDAGPYGSSRSMVLSGLENFYLLKNAEPQFLGAMTNYYAHFQLVDSFEDVQEKIIKINAKFTPDEMDQARLWLNQTFEGVTAMTTGFDNIDIIPNGSNKSVGLNHLCSHFGITGQDVVAFGDNQNDLDMLDFAGLAIATENAREEVKARADLMIGHCNDGAVLAYLEEEVYGN